MAKGVRLSAVTGSLFHFVMALETGRGATRPCQIAASTHVVGIQSRDTREGKGRATAH